MTQKDSRRLALQGSPAQQTFDVGRTPGHGHLQPRRIPVPRLRAARVLRGAAATQAVQHVKDHRHGGLASRVGVGDGRLIHDLGYGFVGKRRRREIDDRPHAGHRRADGDTAIGELGDGRPDDALGVALLELRQHRAVRSGADEVSPEERCARFLGHDLAESLDERLGVDLLPWHARYALPGATTYWPTTSGEGSGLRTANPSASAISVRTVRSSSMRLSRSSWSACRSCRA